MISVKTGSKSVKEFLKRLESDYTRLKQGYNFDPILTAKWCLLISYTARYSSS